MRGMRSLVRRAPGAARGAARLGLMSGAAGMGARGGRGLMPRGQPRGLKRKAAESASGAPEPKRLMQVDTWETQPIVQQPLNSNEDEWYQDSWA